MKISNNWLKSHISTDLSSEKISAFLTDIGLEVEGVEKFESIKGALKGIVVGKVLSVEQHPNADKLKLTKINIGQAEPLSIVCGASNVIPGITIPVATIGTTIYSPAGNFEIKKSKIRGEESFGMLCGGSEIGIEDDVDGLLILDPTYEAGKNLSDYIEVYNDEVYEIGLTPNRTDAMSHYGVARDLQAFLSNNGLNSELKKIESLNLTGEASHNFSLEVENNELCPRYNLAVIENVTIAPSPQWLKNYLQAIGLKPINNVVDATNYILHSIGQPLHAFDAKHIVGKKIKVGTATANTKFTTLDGVERRLNGTEIMIKDDANNPLCMAGVMGGANSGVGPTTQTVVLESAYFNPVAVRKASKHHAINSDSSFRFERGVDPHLTQTAIKQAIQLMTEITGGHLVGDIVEHYPSPIASQYVVLRYSKLDSISGIKIHRQKVKEILRSLEIQILNEIPDGLEINVPPYRADVSREIDVIEEILRIYGFNKIEAPSKFSFSTVKQSPYTQDAIEDQWANNLLSNGFFEVMNNSLCALSDETNAVKLLNPLSSELMFMRKSLLEGILDNIIYNINRKSPNLKFFEFGKIYHHISGEYAERKQVAMAITGQKNPESWNASKEVCSFYDIKAFVKLLLDRTGIEYTEVAAQDERFEDMIALQANNKIIAKIGVVKQDLLKKKDIAQAVFYAEIELEACFDLQKKENFVFKDIPKFNKTRRDLALLVDQQVSYYDLYQTAKNNSNSFLKNINLFDVYQGKNLPEGKKSYAMSFELLNEDKTLEEKEITSLMNKLIKAFEKDFQAELRS